MHAQTPPPPKTNKHTSHHKQRQKTNDELGKRSTPSKVISSPIYKELLEIKKKTANIPIEEKAKGIVSSLNK